LHILNNDMKIIITENKVEKLKGLIKTQGIENVSKLMGGFYNLIKVLGVNGINEVIYDYLNDNLTPTKGWKDTEEYIELAKDIRTVHFIINGQVGYSYTLYPISGNTLLFLYPATDKKLRETFEGEEIWGDVLINWFKDKTGLKVDRIG